MQKCPERTVLHRGHNYIWHRDQTHTQLIRNTILVNCRLFVMWRIKSLRETLPTSRPTYQAVTDWFRYCSRQWCIEVFTTWRSVSISISNCDVHFGTTARGSTWQRDSSCKVNKRWSDCTTWMTATTPLKPSFGKQYCPKAHTSCFTTYMQNNKPVKI